MATTNPIYITSCDNSSYTAIFNGGMLNIDHSSTTSGRNKDLGNFNISKSGVNNAVPSVSKINAVHIYHNFKQSRGSSIYHSQLKTTVYSGSTVKMSEQSTGDVQDNTKTSHYTMTNFTREELANQYIKIHLTSYYKGTLGVTQSISSVYCTIDWEPIYTSAITLNKSSLTLKPGETSTLIATVSPSAITYPGVTWSTSNSNVATVSNGVVTAIGTGSCTITCTANDGTGKRSSCAVTVFNPVTSVISSPSTITLNKGIKKTNLFDFNKWKTYGLVAAGNSPVHINGNGLSITSLIDDTYLAIYHMNPNASDGEKALIDRYGFEIEPSQVYSFACEVTQGTDNNSDLFVFWYDINKNYISLNVNTLAGQNGTLATVAESPANAKYVIFRLDNNVAGKTNVYSNIRVYKGDNYELGDSGDVSAQVIPENASNQGYSLVSNNTNIVTVDNNGILKALRAGTTTITITTLDGSKQTTTTVTVNAPEVGTNIKLGNLDIDSVYLGTTPITHCYLGNMQIF